MQQDNMQSFIYWYISFNISNRWDFQCRHWVLLCLGGGSNFFFGHWVCEPTHPLENSIFLPVKWKCEFQFPFPGAKKPFPLTPATHPPHRSRLGTWRKILPFSLVVHYYCLARHTPPISTTMLEHLPPKPKSQSSAWFSKVIPFCPQLLSIE